MTEPKKQPINFIPVGVGTMLSSMVIAGFLLGYVTDYLLDTLPLFLLIFGFLGFVGGMVRVKQILTGSTVNQTTTTKPLKKPEK